MIQRTDLRAFRDQIETYLRGKLLPFWFSRCRDDRYGGFITHFDRHGGDTGEDEKSLIAQSRLLYTFASAYRTGYGETCLMFAEHGFRFLIDRMWDQDHGGFFWTVNRRGDPAMRNKVLYGHSFAIYALSEYAIATGDARGREYAERSFDLVQKHAADTMYGGYFEMFDSAWNLAGPDAAGGDRKTLDVHMHLMEAFTTLYECTGASLHRRKLLEDIAIVTTRLLHPVHRTGIPQFRSDWTPAPQIKFDVVWGWDRFKEDGVKSNPDDNTSYGHNVELAWLLMHALDILHVPVDAYRPLVETMLRHALRYGIDREYGGVYVEGAHDGPASDREKEFWQQCEVMIGMIDAYNRFGDSAYLDAYANVHRFMFAHGINDEQGEMWPLLTREGSPIWTHMSHSWKINYHSVRAMIQARQKLDAALDDRERH